VKFIQEADTHQSGFNDQELIVEVHDATDGPFLTIETERWAFDNKEELMELLSKVEGLLKND